MYCGIQTGENPFLCIHSQLYCLHLSFVIWCVIHTAVYIERGSWSSKSTQFTQLLLEHKWLLNCWVCLLGTTFVTADIHCVTTYTKGCQHRWCTARSIPLCVAHLFVWSDSDEVYISGLVSLLIIITNIQYKENIMLDPITTYISTHLLITNTSSHLLITNSSQRVVWLIMSLSHFYLLWFFNCCVYTYWLLAL